MRALFKLVLWLIVLSPFAIAAATWFALSDQALVLETAKLSHQDIAHAQSILKSNDPKRLSAGSEREIRINEKDLNLAANFLLQKVTEGGAQIRLHPGVVDAVGTLRIPGLPIKPYLNIQLQLADHQGEPKVTRLQIGQITIPSMIAEFALSQGIAQLYKTNEYKLASNVLKKMDMQSGHLLVTYQWDPALIKQARETLLNTGDVEALQVYHEKLLRLQAQGVGKNGSLTKLLQPLFKLAKERSDDKDPIVENQSLLAILGAWASGHGLSRLVPEATAKPSRFLMKLEGRTDFGQHFLTSAALAAQGDSQIADAVGLFKEISDSEGGSGFSFTDIAADRAGTRFGDLATKSIRDARKVQRLLAAGVRETDIMPKARDLPEHMKAADFKRRFEGVGSAAYKKVMTDIEQRIAACPLYRN